LNMLKNRLSPAAQSELPAVSADLWREMICITGHDVPGEGEHKIMEYIRWAKRDTAHPWEPNQRHCMYGLDADLIMLSLVTHEPHFCLLREVVSFSGAQQSAPALQLLVPTCCAPWRAWPCLVMSCTGLTCQQKLCENSIHTRAMEQFPCWCRRRTRAAGAGGARKSLRRALHPLPGAPPSTPALQRHSCASMCTTITAANTMPAHEGLAISYSMTDSRP